MLPSSLPGAPCLYSQILRPPSTLIEYLGPPALDPPLFRTARSRRARDLLIGHPDCRSSWKATCSGSSSAFPGAGVQARSARRTWDRWVTRTSCATARHSACGIPEIAEPGSPVRSSASSGSSRTWLRTFRHYYLSYAPSHLPPPDPADPLAALEMTEPFCGEWSAQARIEEGERRGAVMLAAAGGCWSPRPGSDHVQHHRGATSHRMGNRLVTGYEGARMITDVAHGKHE